MKNNGIVVHGGTINAQNMVVGKNSSLSIFGQNVMGESQNELLKRFDVLITEMENNHIFGGQYGYLIDAAKQAKDEAKKEKPSKDTLDAVLSIIEKGTVTFSGIAKAVMAVREAAGVFFGI